MGGVDGLTITNNIFTGSDEGKGIKVSIFYDSGGDPWDIGSYPMTNIIISDN